MCLSFPQWSLLSSPEKESSFITQSCKPQKGFSAARAQGVTRVFTGSWTTTPVKALPCHRRHYTHIYIYIWNVCHKSEKPSLYFLFDIQLSLVLETANICFSCCASDLGKPPNPLLAHRGNERMPSTAPTFPFNSQVLDVSPSFLSPFLPNPHCPCPCHQHRHPLRYSPVQQWFSNLSVYQNNQ